MAAVAMHRYLTAAEHSHAHAQQASDARFANYLTAQQASNASLVSITLMTLIVAGLYKHKGWLIVMRTLAYLFSLSTITLTVKDVYMDDFRFPRFVSALHLFACGAIAFAIMLYRQRRGEKAIKIPSWTDFLLTFVPIATVISSSIVVNNMALSHIGTGLVELVSGCAPVFVFFIGALFEQTINYKLLWPVVVVCLGTATCVEGKLHFSSIGLGLALIATFLRAAKSTMQYTLMSGGENARMDPVELLAWLSIPSLVIMLAWSSLVEGAVPYKALYKFHSTSLQVSLLVSCINAVILNFAYMFVVRDLGAIGVIIVAQLKGILIILSGGAMLGGMMNVNQCLGYCVIVAGVFWFNSVEEKGDKKHQAMEHTTDLEKTVNETSSLLNEAVNETYETFEKRFAHFRQTVSEASSWLNEAVSQAYETSKETVSQAYATSKETVSQAYETSAETVSKTYENSKQSVADLFLNISESIRPVKA
jgi:drug/metabolite transporter (DMT)-like permease